MGGLNGGENRAQRIDQGGPMTAIKLYKLCVWIYSAYAIWA
jgi:hypothetical protein